MQAENSEVSPAGLVAVAVGVVAVMLLTSLGEGTRRYIIGQFTQFGTNLVAVQPGNTKTFGFPGVFGGTTEPLTVEDAVALERLPGVERPPETAFLLWTELADRLR